MSRSDCRKYKRYRQTHLKEADEGKKGRTRQEEHQLYFGEIAPRRVDGVIDLTPYAAAVGQYLISVTHFDNGRSVVKRRGRPTKQRAL